MKWIEIKMRELGVSTHSSYKLTAFMDNTAMVTVHTAQRGKHKALQVSPVPQRLQCLCLGPNRLPQKWLRHTLQWHVYLHACVDRAAGSSAIYSSAQVSKDSSAVQACLTASPCLCCGGAFQSTPRTTASCSTTSGETMSSTLRMVLSSGHTGIFLPAPTQCSTHNCWSVSSASLLRKEESRQRPDAFVRVPWQGACPAH